MERNIFFFIWLPSDLNSGALCFISQHTSYYDKADFKIRYKFCNQIYGVICCLYLS